MKQSILRFFGILFCIFGLLPSANADFIKANALDASTLNQLITKIQKVIGSGKYKGKTLSGEVCQAWVEYGNDPLHPYINLASDHGGFLKISPAEGEYTSYLFGNTETDGDNQVQFIGEVDQQETSADALYVNIVGTDGVPSSVQIGLPHGTHGGGRPFRFGDVVPISHITMFPTCNELVRF